MPVCASCGQDNPDVARFCLACGTPLAAPAADAREERKVVTVLFADLVGFTSRAERLDPEDVGALLAPYWERVRAELERHGGTVEKFIGDAVVAFFGAPVAHEDDPERAVRAALAIRDWIVEQHADLQLRIAVTTGEALVRLGARPLEGEGIASGDVVNTAARLQAAAPANGVLVDEPTFRATAHAIDYRAAPPVGAKGKAEPVLVWEAAEARARLGVDMPTAYATPLVGRERELDELRNALGRARHESEPQLVTVVGVPGIGKSRLVHELSVLVDAEPELVRWRQGRSLPYGEGASFWALAEMVKAEAGIFESDDEPTAETKLQHAVAEAIDDDGERAWVALRLRPLVGLPTEDVAAGDLRPEFFAAWRRYLEGLAERRPTVLVFEDLHWADDDLLDFVDHLADWASGVPLLVVGTARPELLERRPGWGGGKRNAATLSLAPLGELETAELLAGLDAPAVPVELQSELLVRAGGNPLYAEQYARMVAERGGGDGDDGGLAVPETVQGIIAARLDALPPEEKGLLQDAAVLGKVFWLGAVGAIGGTDQAAAEQRLHLLERKEFVRRSRRSSVAGEVEYGFAHGLVREVAYNQIPRAARAEKHRLAAAWLGGLGRPDDHADLLAHHHLAALELARAAGGETEAIAASARAALVDAGDRAFAVNAHRAAFRCFKTALDLWPEDDPEYPLVLYRAARAEYETGNSADFLPPAVEALVAAGEAEKAAQIATRLALVTWMAGDRPASMEHLARATELTRDVPPSEAKGYVLASQARFRMLAGDWTGGAAAGEEGLAMAEALGLDALRGHLLNTIGVVYVARGESDRGIRALHEGVAIAERLNAASEVIRGYVNLANCYWFLGDSAAMCASQARGLELARRFGSTWGTIFLTAERAFERYERGDWTGALEDADFVIAETISAPHLMEATARVVRAKLASARGDVAFAVQETERSLEIGRRQQDPQSLFPTLVHRAEMLDEAGRTDEATALVDELVALLDARRHSGSLDWTVPLALLLRARGREDELRPFLDDYPLRTRWLDAVRGVLAGDLAAAADALSDVGASADAARMRLEAAADLAGRGRRREADEQLQTAIAFFRSVDAPRLLQRADEILAAVER